jgi:hypothetical protein
MPSIVHCFSGPESGTVRFSPFELCKQWYFNVLCPLKIKKEENKMSPEGIDPSKSMPKGKAP